MDDQMREFQERYFGDPVYRAEADQSEAAEIPADESAGLRAFLDRLATERGPVDESLVQSITDRL